MRCLESDADAPNSLFVDEVIDPIFVQAPVGSVARGVEFEPFILRFPEGNLSDALKNSSSRKSSASF